MLPSSLYCPFYTGNFCKLLKLCFPSKIFCQLPMLFFPVMIDSYIRYFDLKKAISQTAKCGDDVRCSVRASRSCSTSGTCHVILVMSKNLMISHDRGKEDRIVTTTKPTNLGKTVFKGKICFIWESVPFTIQLNLCNLTPEFSDIL